MDSCFRYLFFPQLWSSMIFLRIIAFCKKLELESRNICCFEQIYSICEAIEVSDLWMNDSFELIILNNADWYSVQDLFISKLVRLPLFLRQQHDPQSASVLKIWLSVYCNKFWTKYAVKEQAVYTHWMKCMNLDNYLMINNNVRLQSYLYTVLYVFRTLEH